MVTHTNTIGGANEDNQQYIFFTKPYGLLFTCNSMNEIILYRLVRVRYRKSILLDSIL